MRPRWLVTVTLITLIGPIIFAELPTLPASAAEPQNNIKKGSFSQNSFNSQVIAQDIKTHKVYAMSMSNGQVFHFFIQPSDKNLFSTGENIYANINSGKVSVNTGPVNVSGLEITLSHAFEFRMGLDTMQSTSVGAASEAYSKMFIRPDRIENDLVKACCYANSNKGIIFRLPDGVKQEELGLVVYPFNKIVVAEKREFSASLLRCFQITGTWTDASASTAEGGILVDPSTRQGWDLNPPQAARPATDETKHGNLPSAKTPTIRYGEPCCAVVANAALKGRMGRIVVAFPNDAVPKATRIAVLKDGKEVKAGFGSQTWDLLPGSYDVVISGKQVPNVTVQSGHDTNVKVGVLRVTAAKTTRSEVVDTGKALAAGHGNHLVGLPAGSYEVKVLDVMEPVTISEGQITDF